MIGAKGMIAVGIVVETEAGIADVGDADALGVAAEAAEAAETVVLRAGGICRLRNTLLLMGKEIRGATTIAGRWAVLAQGPWRPWNRERMTLCCLANRWRSIASARRRLRLHP
jgi:hypothetical protein